MFFEKNADALNKISQCLIYNENVYLEKWHFK